MSKVEDGPDYESDEAVARWGAVTVAEVSENPTRAKHIPFYKFTYYPDVLDLRKAGYEIENFAAIFDLLDDAHVRHAQAAHKLLHLPSDSYGGLSDGAGGNLIWTPRRARELEFQVRAAMHRFGMSDVPTLLRRMIGKAFPGDSMTHISVDLLNIFFWAAMAKVARDLSWRSPKLEFAAEYLEYPVKRAFLISK